MSDSRETPSLTPAARRIRDMFSGLVEDYDRLNHVLSLSVDRLWWRHTARVLAKKMKNVERPRVLDVCAGTGDLSLAIKKRLGERSLLVASDFAHPTLVRARKKSERKQETLLIAEADTLALPFPDGTFHAVTVSFGLRNLVDRKFGVREMARVLRPGGYLLILEFSLPANIVLRSLYRPYLSKILPRIGNRLARTDAYDYFAQSVEGFPPREEVRCWMREAGLTDTSCENLTTGISVLYAGRKR
ncbi:ubiquinone/menaquinone biosynthesis methyltransferase, partial [bacterium]|nr:ubiquinone/menaquinone biosynthesis methyltransferase [bacterium]